MKLLNFEFELFVDQNENKVDDRKVDSSVKGIGCGASFVWKD